MFNQRTKIIGFLMILLVSATACSGSPANAASNPTLIWKVSVTKYELKDSLQSVEVVTQYNGTKTDLQHQQSPASGDVYLIINLTLSKINADSVAFDWSKLSVRDQNGSAYQRYNNDTFLEQFSYTPRLTGLVIRLGVNTGWLCFEIPAEAAKGQLTVTYTAEGSQQEIPLK